MDGTTHVRDDCLMRWIQYEFRNTRMKLLDMFADGVIRPIDGLNAIDLIYKHVCPRMK